VTEATRGTQLGLVGLAGLLVGAALIGGAWLLTGDEKKTASPGTPGAAAPGGDLSAPERLGGFVHQDKVALDLDDGGKSGQETAERVRTWDSKSGKRLSDAYDGAPAVVRSFANSSFDSLFQLAIVRGSSPRPYVPYEDPVALGLEVATNQMVTFKEVDCVLYNQPTNAGNEPDSDAVSVVSCQRADAGLTVQIRNLSGDIAHKPSQVARLVDEVWAELT
jgi:hypothetical protein